MSSVDGPPAANHVDLYVRAGRDGLSPGGCPMCQHIFLVLSVKSEYGPMTFSVTSVNMAKPPDVLRKTVNRLPAIVHDGETLTDPDEIVQYIDNRFPDPVMSYDSRAAADACRDVFSKFSFFVKDVSHNPTQLLTELKRLDAYLSTSGHRYLCGDEHFDHLDCMMLPKLQHIRVAASVLRDFTIPAELSALWRYLDAAYQSDVFVKTCPSDQEIISHWLEKPECKGSMDRQKAKATIDAPPTYSFFVPAGIKE